MRCENLQQTSRPRARAEKTNENSGLSLVCRSKSAYFLDCCLVLVQMFCWQIHGCSGTGICSSCYHGKSGAVSGRSWTCPQEEKLSAQSCGMDGCLGQVVCLCMGAFAFAISSRVSRGTPWPRGFWTRCVSVTVECIGRTSRRLH